MTFNDLRVNADCLLISGKARRLSHVQATGWMSEVKAEIQAIVDAGKDALERIEELERERA